MKSIRVIEESKSVSVYLKSLGNTPEGVFAEVDFHHRPFTEYQAVMKAGDSMSEKNLEGCFNEFANSRNIKPSKNNLEKYKNLLSMFTFKINKHDIYFSQNYSLNADVLFPGAKYVEEINEGVIHITYDNNNQQQVSYEFIKVSKRFKKILNGEYEVLIRDVLKSDKDLMDLLMKPNEYTTRESSVPIVSGNKKKDKSKSKSNNVSYIRKKSHIIDIVKSETTRNYIQTKKAWSVRGHWRFYDSGKKIWIQPYVKGQQQTIDNIIENKFKLTTA